MMELHIVVTGNPVNGFRFFGPFKTEDDAVVWGEQECPHDEWWVSPLEAPEDEDNG